MKESTTEIVLIREGSPEREGGDSLDTESPYPRAPARNAGIFLLEDPYMETRIALVGIIVEDHGETEKINQILHEYAGFIIGRMGIPYRQQGIAIISVVLDAPQDAISSLSGKLGMLNGVSAKTVYSRKTIQS